MLGNMNTTLIYNTRKRIVFIGDKKVKTLIHV